MSNSSYALFIKTVSFCFLSTLSLISCDRNSSPEGRMSIKIENLQKEMIDSLKKQNRDILDSLGKIREDLREIRAQTK
jgi:hypothetical protein